MAAPCALFASCSKLDPLEIVKQIIIGDGDSTSFPLPIPLMEDIKGFPWHIDTKYYTADIQLCTTENRTIGNKSFADDVQAIVLHFDTTEVSSFDLVKAWLPYLKEIEPAVQILVCNRCALDDVVPRRKALEWCIENEFELVELNPIQDDSDSDEDFRETTGVKRIVQALHAHTWPNLEMKERPTFRSPMIAQLMREEAAARAQAQSSVTGADDESAGPVSSEEPPVESATVSSDTSNIPECSAARGEAGTLEPGSSTEVESSVPVAEMESLDLSSGACAEEAAAPGTASSAEPVDYGKARKEQKEKSNEELAEKLIPNEDLRMLAAVGSDDPDGESFELMFERLRNIKEKAESMPPEQRKAYAERVAVEFWKSIGGEADEIDGLSDSD